jgi:cell division protein FtsL
MSALTTAAARTRLAVGRPAPSTGPAERPRLRVVPRPRRTGRYLALMAVVAAAGIFGVVSLSALAAESAFAARALEAEIDDLALRYDELTAEVAGLESPERVREVATAELGMVRAAEPAFLVVERWQGKEATPAAQPTVAEELSDDPLKQALGTGS